MPVLHIFNPEHDLALAVGKGPYTPPYEVVNLRKYNSLLPASFAGNSDLILLPPEVERSELSRLPFYDNAIRKNIRLIFGNQLHEYFEEITSIQPWGWDHAVKGTLISLGTPQHLLPSENFISEIRRLSHRNTVIPFRTYISNFLGYKIKNLPEEICNISDVPKFLDVHPKAYLKAPWSSSGRGIVVSDHISPKGLLEWAHGAIKKQGSIIAEPAWDRCLDFASEWDILEGKAYFKGLSLFETSSRGKYHKNFYLPQSEILSKITQAAPKFGSQILQAQKNTLETLIAPYYSGPLGIDMLADTEGDINPCVEINLRLTMGYITL